MNKIKIIVLIFIVWLMCGCTAKYNITIDKNLKVTEQLYALETKDFYNKYIYSSIDRVIDVILQPRISELNALNYKYDKYYSNDYNGLKIEKRYASIKEFIVTNKLYKQFFEELKYEENGDNVRIYTDGKFYQYVKNDPEKYIVEDAEISISLPYIIINNNANKCEYKNKMNTCYWRIDKYTKDEKLVLEFNKKKIQSKQNFELIYIIPVIIVIIALYSMLIIFKIRKNNEI